MKYIIPVLVLFATLVSSQSIYKKVKNATNSGITVGSTILENDRPKGFIIKRAGEYIDLNNNSMFYGDEKEEKRAKMLQLIKLNIKFDFDKYYVKPEYLPHLKEVAIFLNKNRNYKVIVDGHTDSKGDKEYNLKLSKKRSNAVAEKLIKLGVDKNKIVANGFGESNPIAVNTTKNGRAKNRRVNTIFNKLKEYR